jgi:hypothetical protein
LSEIDPAHSQYSSLREKVIEHLFVGDLLRFLWRRGVRDMEVLRSEVDRGGYDLVVECNGVWRHIQLKASHLGTKTSMVNVNLHLARKPTGCVVWIRFDRDTLELGPYLWFGAEPGKVLPELGSKVGRHTRGNKAERPSIRVLRKTQFLEIPNVAGLVQKLFGDLPEQEF